VAFAEEFAAEEFAETDELSFAVELVIKAGREEEALEVSAAGADVDDERGAEVEATMEVRGAEELGP